jgi:hypothetical protein
MNTFATNQALKFLDILEGISMPHKNYCQQCGKTVNPKNHKKGHNVIKDVAEEQAKRGHLNKDDPVKEIESE